MIENFPFMLSVSKHSEPFFSNLLVAKATIKTGIDENLSSWGNG